LQFRWTEIAFAVTHEPLAECVLHRGTVRFDLGIVRRTLQAQVDNVIAVPLAVSPVHFDAFARSAACSEKQRQ
jgi:hypothetical protein